MTCCRVPVPWIHAYHNTLCMHTFGYHYASVRTVPAQQNCKSTTIFIFPFRRFYQVVKSLTSISKWSLNANLYTYLCSMVIYTRFPFEKPFWIFQNIVSQLSMIRFTWNTHHGKAHFRIYSEMPTMTLYSQSERPDSFRRISHRNRAHTKCHEKRCRVLTFDIGPRKMTGKAAHALLLSP